jgi:hypothetical protein
VQVPRLIYRVRRRDGMVRRAGEKQKTAVLIEYTPCKIFRPSVFRAAVAGKTEGRFREIERGIPSVFVEWVCIRFHASSCYSDTPRSVPVAFREPRKPEASDVARLT